MIKLTRKDFNNLVTLLSGRDVWRTERARWRLIDDVLTGVPREDRIRGLLDLSGNPRGSAVSVIKRFQEFGQPQAGKELLGILANKLLDGYIFEPEPVAFLEGLFRTYPLDEAVSAQPAIDTWRGTTNPDDITEKIIGENTLRDIFLLELALAAGQAVVRIRNTYYGTGFLCGDNIIMTNHHVIPDEVTAQGSEFTFFYELDNQQQERMSHTVEAVPDGLFFTDADLDVTLVQIGDVPDDVQPLTLKQARLKRDERVSIIQHPGGHYKKISMQNNFVAYADANVLQYTTSTEPGSSGSPVFNDNFEVIAIHHSGGMLSEPGNMRRYLRNAGTTMIAALRAVQKANPELYAALNIDQGTSYGT